MSHLGTIEPPSAVPGIGRPAPHSRQGHSLKPDTLATVAARHHREDKTQEHVQAVEPTDTKVLAEEDDEVQFVFWAPRRKKKKRKRAESSQSHSDPRKRSRAPSNINSTPADPTSGRQRRITSMSKQLETCHIEKDKKAATTGIYASPYTILSPMDPALNLQSASFTPPAESNQAAVPSFPFPHPSMSWWNDPLPSIQPDSTFNHDWRPVLYGETPNKNRKSDGELEEAMLHPTQGPRRVQLSPQTSHGAAVSDIGNSFGGMHSRTLDMFGGSNLQPEFGPANPSQSAMASWPNFTWNPFDNVSAGQGMPRYLPQAIMPINMTVADRMWPNNQFSPQQFIQTSASSSRIQNNSRDPQSDQSSISPKTNPSALPLAQYIQPSTPATQRRSHQQHMSAQSQSARTAPLATSTGSNNQGQVSNALFHSPANQQKVPKDTTFPPPVHSQFHTLPSDIQRKPSLYKIPRWPSRPESHSPSHPLKTVAQPPSSSTNVNSDMGPNIPTESRTNKSDHPLPASNEVQSQQDGLQALSDLTSVQSAIRAATPQAATFQDQDQLAGDPSPENSSARKAGRKKHSPNLIVDIAETCQENFPFAAVAERHTVPIQKVFDSFSAIIQLPLLRSADDKRRHGSLGKRRMKEYKDAKKAMEKAQDAERKAHLKAVKTRLEVEFAQKKSKGPSKAPGLLKAAILNNARESQANAST